MAYTSREGHPSTSTPASHQDFERSSVAPVDLVVVTALEEELEAVLDKLPAYQKLGPFEDDIRVYFHSTLSITFPDGRAGSYNLVVMPLLAMGRVQATVATSDAIRRWNPRYMLLVGIAGGVAENDVKLGDILVSTQVVDYELQKLGPEGPEIRWEVHRADPRLIAAARAFDETQCQELAKVKRPGGGSSTCHIGPIASGDKVIASTEVLSQYKDKWPKLIGVEMEAAGVATASFQSPPQPGFFMVRGVSDLADQHKNSARVKKWRFYACDIAAAYAITLLKSGPVPLLDRQGWISSEMESVAPVESSLSSDTLDTEAAELNDELQQVTKLPQQAVPVAFLKLDLGTENILCRISEPMIVIGRAKNCHLEIPDKFDNVERYHFTIALNEGFFTIADGYQGVPTRYGTFVNGIKVEPNVLVLLRNGDRIVLGGFKNKETHELARGACEIVFEEGRNVL